MTTSRTFGPLPSGLASATPALAPDREDPARAVRLFQLRPMGVGDVLDAAIAFYRRNVWTLCGIVLCTVGLVKLASGPLLSWLRGRQTGSFFDTEALLVVGGVYILLLLAEFLIALFAEGALTIAVHRRLVGQPTSCAGALAAALPCFGRLVAASALQLALVLGLCAGLLGLAFLAATWIPHVLGLVVFALLSLVTVAMTLVVFVALFVLPQVIVLEGLGVLEAFSRSTALMLRRSDRTVLRGTLAKATAILVVVTVLTIAVPLVSEAPAFAWRTYAAFRLGDTTALDLNYAVPAWIAVPSHLLQVLLACAVMPVGGTAMVLLYLDIRMRTEGYDLALRLAAEDGDTAAGPQ